MTAREDMKCQMAKQKQNYGPILGLIFLCSDDGPGLAAPPRLSVVAYAPTP